MRPLQKFSDPYLESCREMTSDQIIGFLEDFRRVHGNRPAPSRLISMKVPEDLLAAFKTKAKLTGVRYQPQIKELMRAWVMAPLAPDTGDSGARISPARSPRAD